MIGMSGRNAEANWTVGLAKSRIQSGTGQPAAIAAGIDMCGHHVVKLLRLPGMCAGGQGEDTLDLRDLTRQS